MKKLLFLLLICLGTAAFLCVKFQQIVNTPQKIEGEKILQINSGDSLLNVASSLYEQKLINQKWQFILYMKINRLYPNVKAGEYLVDKDISIVELGNLITSGKAFLRKITFAEGLTSREIANILLNNNYLSNDFKSFNEGYVLPETYTFSRGDTRQKIVNKAHAALKETLQQAWDERDADLPLKNKEEMLILASIVEKETGVANERPQVASVFINRLRKGMLLQTDPTVIYALTQGKTDLRRKLTLKDLETDNPYNTYKYAGLPPTPICNPGKAAIMAVAHPDKTPYLYFVASGNGGHNFARTLAEHNDNVRQWRRLNK
ncbi:MAG: endolytic transglycosylase MltG [Alphaproteobacteria bacterium]|nr:endolytic transglycosylase MltG [Alphaproteobacteria bacterium]